MQGALSPVAGVPVRRAAEAFPDGRGGDQELRAAGRPSWRPLEEVWTCPHPTADSGPRNCGRVTSMLSSLWSFVTAALEPGQEVALPREPRRTLGAQQEEGGGGSLARREGGDHGQAGAGHPHPLRPPASKSTVAKVSPVETPPGPHLGSI